MCLARKMQKYMSAHETVEIDFTNLDMKWEQIIFRTISLKLN